MLADELGEGESPSRKDRIGRYAMILGLASLVLLAHFILPQ